MPVAAFYVDVRTDEGVTGSFGPIQGGQADVIKRSVAPALVGLDALATEALHDRMLGLDRHGRSGTFMTGVSPVDCALWDLKGKALGLPVWRLLGGPTRDKVPCYVSTLGEPTEPDSAAAAAQRFLAEGFPGQKWFFAHGPADGQAGLDRNLALVAAVREAVGATYPIRFDAVMKWTADYALEMIRRMAPYEPQWLEEPVQPERVSTLARLAAAAPFRIVTGEHVATRWQVKQLLDAGATAVVQTDPDWCGGITEQLKICALASAYDIPVIAHGHSLLAALHLAGALPASVVPEIEWLVHAQPLKQHFHAPKRAPVDGCLTLPEEPGLGLHLDHETVESSRAL
jgi:L-alanine-DL-glutamate epimerase-like enolase superfamily enzyme